MTLKETNNSNGNYTKLRYRRSPQVKAKPWNPMPNTEWKYRVITGRGAA